MNEPSCTKCDWFKHETSMCMRIKVGRDQGMKVMRPDVVVCLYFKKVELKKPDGEKAGTDA